MYRIWDDDDNDYYYYYFVALVLAKSLRENVLKTRILVKQKSLTEFSNLLQNTHITH